METLEIEFKNLLTQAEFQALYNTYQLDTQPSWEQTNVYYDTPQHHLAEKSGITLATIASPCRSHFKDPC